VEAAVDAAHAARAIAPWAPTPYLQLALIREQSGDLEVARTRIREALDRDETDWRLWLVSARIETKLGSVATATRHLARARALNPRSPAFSTR
jgi:Flp pilus assembly protein TadD